MAVVHCSAVTPQPLPMLLVPWQLTFLSLTFSQLLRYSLGCCKDCDRYLFPLLPGFPLKESPVWWVMPVLERSFHFPGAPFPQHTAATRRSCSSVTHLFLGPLHPRSSMLGDDSKSPSESRILWLCLFIFLQSRTLLCKCQQKQWHRVAKKNIQTGVLIFTNEQQGYSEAEML